jgi:predicted nucleic acid-binding Zn ribbon protein
MSSDRPRGRRGGPPQRRDPIAEVRRAGAQDRDERVYERKRARQARQRAKQDREGFDPAPPTDDDWTVPEEATDAIRRISPPEPIGYALGRFVERRGWSERLRGADAWTRWGDIVGDDLASRCEPVRLAGGTLVVRASSQVWATQLRYLSSQLRANAERMLGPGTVTQVRIVVGPLEGRSEPERN